MTDLSPSTIRHILAAPWQQRRNARGLWILVLIASLSCSISIALFAWSLFMTPELAVAMRHSAAASGRIVIVALLFAWWAVVVSNVLEQNHPTFARLVPNHPSQLRLALIAGDAGLVALTSLALYGDVPDPLACAVCAALGGTLLAAAVRWPLLWILGGVLPFVLVAPWRSAGLSDAIDFALRQWHDQRLTIAATGFVASIAGLAALVQDGGRRHVANYAARRDLLLRMQAAARGESSLRRCHRGPLADLIHSPYHAWLRHVLATPAGSVRARTLLGLGPGVHWTTVPIAFVVTAVGIACGVGLLELVAVVFPVFKGFVPVLLASVAVSVMFGLLTPGMQMQTRLHQTRREQALLALLPGVPQQAALNRWLGWQLSAQFLAAWLGGLVLMATFSALARHLGPPAVDISYPNARALMVLATLPLVLFQWRRWARLPGPTSLNAGFPALLGLALAALAFTGRLLGWFTLAEAGIAFALAALAWCALRWWRMGSEPSAFPIGRRA